MGLDERLRDCMMVGVWYTSNQIMLKLDDPKINRVSVTRALNSMVKYRMGEKRVHKRSCNGTPLTYVWRRTE